MPSRQPQTGRRRRVATAAASRARQTRSASQQSPLPRLSASRFIVSSSSSGSNASTASSPKPRDRETGRRRRSPPIAAARQPSATAVEDHYCWPAVRQYINNGAHKAGSHRIRVICPICRDELPVRGLEPSSELIQHEGGVVIGCGHIFCRSCLADSFRTQRDQNLRRTCPMCRAKMECQRCGVQGRWADIPKEYGDPNDYQELPQTVPEGGDLPSNCLRCSARDWWISRVERGQHGLPFHNRIESDFQRLMYHMMDRMEDDRVAMGMVEMEQQLLVLFKQNFMRLLEEREKHISRYMYNHMSSAVTYSWQ
ncbi:hypothetical protein V8C42DRAFT_328920 [Trichoderma barbatum]